MNTQPQWKFGGSVPESYERHLVPSIFGPWAHDLVETAALRAGERVLDIACGDCGAHCRAKARRRWLRRRSGSGVPMLTVARTAAAAEDLAVEWREGSAAELPIADASFDVAFCQQGLQFLPERPPVLRKMYRVLATGGRLVLSVPGLSRARGSANAARQSRGGHADDQWAIRSSADDHARAELLARVNAKLQSHIDDQGLAFPIKSNIVIARR